MQLRLGAPDLPRYNLQTALILFPWHLGPFLPCLRQANGDRLFRVGDLFAGLATLQLAMLELVHDFLDTLLGFLSVTGHIAITSSPSFRFPFENQCKRDARLRAPKTSR